MVTIVLASNCDILTYDYKNLQANVTAYNYGMKMESYGKGYLTDSDLNSLKTELTNEGFTNINLSGTTMSQVDNGGDIYFNLSCDVKLKSLQFKDNKPSFTDITRTINIKSSSTSEN